MGENLHINPDCNCPKTTCPRHGNCVDCVKHHNKMESLMYCSFPQAERGYEVFYKHLKAKFEA